MKNKISIAIIGGGLNSAVGYAHFSAINLSNKFKIVAGSFSKSTETNKESSNVYGVTSEHLYSDYKTMLLNEKSNIEAVVILTPNNQHIEQIIYAIKLGIPVICEKALTTSYNEIERIKELGNSNFISVVFNYVCYPMLKELKQIIKTQTFSKV